METYATGAAGVGIVDERRLEDRLDDVADGVMHNPVAEGGGGDGAGLRVVNPERAVRAGLPTSFPQLLLQPKQVLLPVQLEGRHVRLRPFALARFVVGAHEVVPVVNARAEVLVTFHPSLAESPP